MRSLHLSIVACRGRKGSLAMISSSSFSVLYMTAGSHPCSGAAPSSSGRASRCVQAMSPASSMSMSSVDAGDVGSVAVTVVGDDGLVEEYLGSPKFSNKSSSENDNSCVSSPGAAGTGTGPARSSISSSSDKSEIASSSSAAGDVGPI